MIPDIFPTLNVWTDVYASTGIAVGTRLSIQNKWGGTVLVWEGATAPGVTGDDNRQGYQLPTNPEPQKTDPTPAGVWVMCWDPSNPSRKGRLCVQVYTP